MSERNIEQKTIIQSIKSKLTPTERVAKSAFIGSFVGLSNFAVFKLVGIEKSNEYFVLFGAGSATGTYLYDLGKGTIPKVYRNVVNRIMNRENPDIRV